MANPKVAPNLIESKGNYKKRQVEFEVLSRDLAERELELATLKNELNSFEKRYACEVGVLFAELDELEKQIAEELLRLHPGELYKRRFQKAEQKAKTSHDSVQENLEKQVEDFIVSEDLKKLYRRLAKAIHPDLTIDENERDYRTELMAKANIAYRNGDKATLEQILVEWESSLYAQNRRETQFRDFDRLDRKILQVKMRIREIEKKINELKKSELYRLMRKVEVSKQQGAELLKDMANDLEQQIEQARVRLRELKRQRI